MKIKNIITSSLILSSLLVADTTPTPLEEMPTSPSFDTYCDAITLLAEVFGNSVIIQNGCEVTEPTPKPTPPSEMPITPNLNSYCEGIEFVSVIFGNSITLPNCEIISTPKPTPPSEMPITPEFQSFCSAIWYLADIFGDSVQVHNNISTEQGCDVVISATPTPTVTPTPEVYYPPTTQPSVIVETIQTNLEIKVNETEITAPKDTKYDIDNNGNAILKVDENIEVKSNTDGTVEIKHGDVNLDLPKGSNVELKEDDSIVITKETKTSENTTVTTNITISKDGLISIEITITNKQPLDYKIPNNAQDTKIEIVDNSLVVSYKTTTTFNLYNTQTTKRGVNYGYSYVKIEPKNSAEFEEKVYFDGKKSIILRNGEANIIIDNKTIPMQEDKEYIVLVIEESSFKEIYYDSILHLNSNWSLISSPINSELNISESFKNASMSYKYLKDWELNPKTLKPQEALWVKYQDEANISLQKYKNQESYDFNESAIKTGWNFVGLGTSLSTKTLTNKTIWGFDGKNWLENPNKIPRGYGVWIKRD